jgi:hypothetical protein
MSARVDLLALHAEEYAAGRAPRVVAAPPARYLAVDGAGDVPGPAFLAQARALSLLLRDVRARVREARGTDFRIPPLEALIGPPRGRGETVDAAGPLPWKLLLRIPAFVRPTDLAAIATGNGNGDGEAFPARIEELREGRCIQLLHVGAFSGLGAALDRRRGAAADQGLLPRGRVHVALLSDAGRTPPERRRTLVRLPVKPR